MTRLQRFFTRFGIADTAGDLSFNKTITAGAGLTFVGTVFYCLVALKVIPPPSVWTFGTIIICAGFGLKGLSIGMARWTAVNTSTENVTVTVDAAAVIAAVRARRDLKLGQEDSGRVPEVHHD